MKEETLNLSFWCHLCQIQFFSNKVPGVDIITCPKCTFDFCEINARATEPKKHAPYQKTPHKKALSFPRVDRRITNVSINELSQILEAERQKVEGIEMTQEDIEKMEKRLEKQYECAVCKQEMKIGESGLSADCKHVYHSQCLVNWLKIKNSCPTCRQKVVKNHENKENSNN